MDKENCSACADVAVSLNVETFGLQGCLSSTFHRDQILLSWYLPLNSENHSQIPLIQIMPSLLVALIFRLHVGFLSHVCL